MKYTESLVQNRVRRAERLARAAEEASKPIAVGDKVRSDVSLATTGRVESVADNGWTQVRWGADLVTTREHVTGLVRLGRW